MKKIMDYRYLKILAVIAMTVDHMGAILMPEAEVLRVIGRMAFPIFLFMIINSYKYTSDRYAFMKRLFILAVVSIVPYYLAFHRFYNIIFAFLGVLLTICFLDYLILEYRIYKKINVLYLNLTLFPLWYALSVRDDYSYSWFAIGMGILIYYREELGFFPYAILSMTMILAYGTFDQGGFVPLFLSLPIYWLLFELDKKLVYRRQTAFQKYFYYVYYPLHLLILVALKAVVS